MTAISSRQNYWQLLLARIGVGVGEAGSMPSHSMISDIFPRNPGRGAGVLLTGISFGILFGFGWRVAFLLLVYRHCVGAGGALHPR